MTTGAILDREISPSYKLAIQALGATIVSRAYCRTGYCTRLYCAFFQNETVTVTINVGDENDNAPTFTNTKPIVFFVEDGSPAETFVGRLRVEDPDSGPNGAVKLSIDSSSPSAS